MSFPYVNYKEFKNRFEGRDITLWGTKDKIGRILEETSSFMNSFIARAGYALPLKEEEGVLKSVCIDLSLYELLSEAGLGSSPAELEIKNKRDAAVSWLEELAQRKVCLPRVAEGEKYKVITKNKPINYRVL